MLLAVSLADSMIRWTISDCIVYRDNNNVFICIIAIIMT